METVQKDFRTEETDPPVREEAFAFPTSFSQQRLWFLDQLEPNQSSYVVPMVWRLAGAFDLAAADFALNRIVERHDTLRTTFATEDGEPIQVVQPFRPFPLPLDDLSEEPSPEAAAAKVTLEQANLPFDLAHGPVFRCRVLRLGKEQHLLLFTTHHIVFDGWSRGVWLREFTTFYRAFLTQQPANLPELEIQYGDFAAWQREHLTGKVLGDHLSFWQTALQGAPGVLEIPTDRPRPAVQSRQGAVVPFTLSAELSSGLRKLARESNATLFMVTLAAWQILLSRWSGQNDLVIGTPIANRERLELEPLIGFFTNTLLMRGSLQPEDSFLDLVARVKRFTLDAYTHQDMPFDKLVEHLQPERSLSSNPLFQVMFALHNPAKDTPSLPGLTLSPAGGGRLEIKADLQLSMVDAPENLRGVLEYSSALFDRTSIEDMLASYRALLESIVADPGVSVASAAILTPEQRQQVLFSWNDTAIEFPLGSLPELFARQASRAPEATALHFGGQTLTYGELDEASNRFARYLGSVGVRPGDLLGISMERSFDMIVALLGIFKAGAAYLALDPSYPTDRLAMMLDDMTQGAAGQASVVAHRATQSRLPATADLILVDASNATWQQLSADPLAIPVPLDQLAYVIHTSGSTGRPKGAMVRHGGVANFVFAMQRIHPLGAEDKFLLKTSLNFDASVWELFWPLSFGAQVVISPPDDYTDLDRTIALMAAQGVTYSFMVPSLLNAILDSPRSAGLASLRCLLCGGERLTLRTIADCRQRLPRTMLYQVYGPTETTITVAAWPTRLDYPYGAGAPLGSPLANVQLYVLDQNMQPVPRGVAGELYIGGAQVGLGYLDRPDLTAERFLPNLFTGSGRMYKTGDKVRHLPDGAIEFLDRLDFQIKLRGQRIELGEIEAALDHHPSVRTSVVIARDDQAGEKRIVAYIVLKPGFEPDFATLRTHLATTLPDYMLPAAFVALDALPLSLNGKVERRALPAPDFQSFASAASHPPETEVQCKIAAVWCDVLKLDTVFLDQDFFQLGGHSLMATRVVSRLREAFAVELPLRALFEHPTLRALAVDVERLSGAGSSGEQLPALTLADRSQPLPLSFAQRRLWFLDQLQPDSSFYNSPLRWRLRGPLDRAALESALHQIVTRHEVLRTTYAVDRQNGGEDPVQIIGPVPATILAVVNLSADLSAGPDPESRALTLADAEAARPFHLARGPLFRATLLTLAADDHILILNTHHIATDGWSFGVLRHELVSLYNAGLSGQPSPLTPLPLQYADYAVWQRETLAGAELERQLSFWKQHLEGAPPAIDLLTDRPRPPLQTYNGARAAVPIAADLLAALTALCQAEGATLYMVLLAAFAALLARYSGQDDIVIGSAIAGRTRSATENLIGLFVNTLALRVDLSSDPGFRALLRRVRTTTVDAYAHQDLPFERLVEAINPVRDSSRSPLYQVMLILQNTPRHKEDLAGLQMAPFGSGGETSKMDLLLSVAEQASGLEASLTYNTDLFDRSTIERMLACFVTALQSIVANPDTPVQALPILPAEERSTVLQHFNATQHPVRDARLHQLVAEQVERTPDAVAVRCAGEQLTYRELDRRANQLAHWLLGQGVGGGTLVGVCAERSLEMVVALLGIQKAAAGYVPIDPEYPLARLESVIEDTRTPVLLTQQHLLHLLPASAPTTLCLDRDWQQVAAFPDTAPNIPVAADDVAYAIYTSGSTGKPKGVPNTHRGIVNRLLWMQHQYGLTPADRVLQKTPYSFDVSVWEFFWPLIQGATLVMAEPQGHKDPDYLVRTIRTEQISTLHFVPSMLRVFLEAPRVEACTSLKRVFASGEALPADVVARFFERLPQVELHNLYGPTEAAVDVTYFPCTPHLKTASVPIGRPVWNTQIHILSPRGEPQPIGVPGELYIAGVQLAQGYLNRPELTAERFVPNPFVPGTRAYRTGDSCRWLADGNIEYLGRLDHQVKLRGFRIELGEIEAVLRQHPTVTEAVVIVREDQPGDQRLVAYAVPQPGASPAAEDLRIHLRASLPDYMVPAAIVLLAAIPLSSNGKLDRRNLPQPAAHAAPATHSHPPRTRMEIALADIWMDILHLHTIHVEDDFFQLGGHSLMATRVVSRLREAFAVELPLRALFEHPTLRALAVDVERLSGAGSSGEQLPALTLADRSQPLPLSFAQRRLWFLDQLQPDSSFYNSPLRWRLRGPLDRAALESALHQIVTRHEVLRTTYAVDRQNGGEDPVQIIGPVPATILAVVNLSADLSAGPDPESRALTLADAEAARPFHLARGPLFRATLLTLAADDHILILNTHHIATDGWSFGVLRHELVSLYNAGLSGQPSPLTPLPLQYADYAVWQRETLAGAELERQLSFWKQHLEGAPPAIDLLTDRPRPPLQTYNGARAAVPIAADLLAALTALCQAEGATLYMVLLAAFAALLARYSGQDDIVIGSAIAGRTRSATENLIGLFVNTLALRVDLSSDPGFRALLRRVRTTTVDAYAHQDLPFERLVEAINPVRDSSRSPLYQVMLILQNTPRHKEDLAGLQMAPFGSGGETSKMDLLLSVAEQASGLEASLTYNTDLFDRSTIERMLACFVTALQSIVANPDTPVQALPILPAEERSTVLQHFNATQHPVRDARLHQLVAEQVERTPDAVAVRCAGEQLTYRELDRRANQLAHWLLGQGVGGGTLVGVCAERSLEMVVALLGIQKAAAGYVPIDPEYPLARLESVIEDTRTPVLLTQQHLLHLLPASAPTTLCLDRDWQQVAAFPDTAPNIPVAADDVAYAIYTSGSTGKPKGVPNTHRGIVNRLLWMQHQYGLTPADRVLQKTPYSFDVSVWEFFWPLIQGATLVMAEPQGHKDPDYLVRTIRTEQISTLHFVPSMLRVFLEAPRVEACTSLKRVFASGEALPADVVARFFERLPQVELHNLYGPTEAAVDVTYFPCTPHLKTASVPIGRPVWNTQIHILSPRGEPQPIGVPGELYIAGVQLAQGYLNRPELTAERFVPNPFVPGTRAYRTGDSCRWLADGNIEYLGRLDHQVKLRGFRIELGEIEAVLRQHPTVTEAVVIVREDQPGDQRLVAYAVPQPGASPAAEDLRIHLRASLPDYMVPAAIVLLAAIPLSSNGKLDRRNLPQPAAHAAPATHSHPPRTRMEIALADIWMDILHLHTIHVEDDFFQLGGHSLMAASMIAKLSETVGYPVRLATLFEAPTLGALAAAADSQGFEQQQVSTIVPIRKQGTKPALFCVSRPNVNALGFLFLSRAVSSQLPVYGLQSNMENDGILAPFTQKEYEEKAAEYVAAMRQVQPEGPYFLTGYCEGAHIAFEMARQLEASNLEVGGLYILDVWPVENTISRPRFMIRNYGRVVKYFFRSSNRDRFGMLFRKLNRRAAVKPKIVNLDNRAVKNPDFDHEGRKYLSNVAAARYWPGKDFQPTVLNGNIVVFRLQKQPFHRIHDDSLGWRSRVRGKVDIIRVPGLHNQILREPGVSVVATELEAHMDRYLAARPANRPTPSADAPADETSDAPAESPA